MGVNNASNVHPSQSVGTTHMPRCWGQSMKRIKLHTESFEFKNGTEKKGNLLVIR